MADLSLIIRPWTDRIIDTAIQQIYPTGVGWHSKSMDPATNSAANCPVIGCMKQTGGWNVTKPSLIMLSQINLPFKRPYNILVVIHLCLGGIQQQGALANLSATYWVWEKRNTVCTYWNANCLMKDTTFYWQSLTLRE